MPLNCIRQGLHLKTIRIQFDLETQQLKETLDYYYDKYNRLSFIETDPISLPHQFTQKQDIEIAALFASVLAWGNRKTIIQSTQSILKKMDNKPYDFILNHKENDLQPFLGFRHRTFNDTDLLYFIHFLHHVYSKHESLEEVFLNVPSNNPANGLNQFYNRFISLENFPLRTKKHIASPQKKSACKRMNMFLRWMVRKDERGVDFGIWNRIDMSDLYIPLDVHVEKTARKLRLLTRKQVDWIAVAELTDNLKKFDSLDPVKYDFALFGMSIESKAI